MNSIQQNLRTKLEDEHWGRNWFSSFEILRKYYVILRFSYGFKNRRLERLVLGSKCFMEVIKTTKFVYRRWKATLDNKVLKIGRLVHWKKGFSDNPIYWLFFVFGLYFIWRDRIFLIFEVLEENNFSNLVFYHQHHMKNVNYMKIFLGIIYENS